MDRILVEHTIKTPYLVSVNSLYEPNLKSVSIGLGRSVKAYYGMRLSNEAVTLKSAIYNELDKAKLKLSIPVDWNKPLEFTLLYVLSSAVKSRDTGNMEKCITDAIFKYFKLNDNRIYALHQYKLCNSSGIQNKEYVKFKLSQPDINISDLYI